MSLVEAVRARYAKTENARAPTDKTDKRASVSSVSSYSGDSETSRRPGAPAREVSKTLDDVLTKPTKGQRAVVLNFPRPRVRCADCAHFTLRDHPFLGDCAAGIRSSVAGNWSTDVRECRVFERPARLATNRRTDR